MKLGVFDSGAGGLTVAKPIFEAGIFDEIVYYGDTARVPYGNKDPATIRRYCIEAVEYLENYNLDMLVVACNTASVVALDSIRSAASYPVVGVVEPGVQSLLNSAKGMEPNVLIIGTQATISGRAYENKLKEAGVTRMVSLATGLFVSLVEENILSGDIVDATIKHYFDSLKPPTHIILACTHFPYLAKEINAYFPDAVLVHSGNAVLEWLESHQVTAGSKKDTKISVIATENARGLRATAARVLGLPETEKA